MIKIIDKRSTGKTSQLMLIAKENGAKFACSNPYAAMEKARAYGITGIDFISYHDLVYGERTEHFTYVVDEIESFLEYIHSGLIGYTDCVED